MKNKIKWRIGFLGVTLLALAMEVYAVFDGDGATEPWTGLIIQYIPEWITFSVIAVFCIWAALHFKKWYKIIKAKRK